MVHFLEILCFNHYFVENIMANPRCILQHWRSFVFLRGQYTKTYLTFYTGITKNVINAYLQSLFFGLCKVLFLTSFCREYCEQREMNFGTLGEVYLNNILLYNEFFHFLRIYLRLRYTKVSLDPNFVEFLWQNA